jgi:hypothetical protein
VSQFKKCTSCNDTKPIWEFSIARGNTDGYQSACKECNKGANKHSNPTHGPQRMYVNGVYISNKHPLYKPGRFRTFGDAAWEALEGKDSDPAGDVYIITNPAFVGWVKVGMAVDAQDRHRSYQTSDPHRDYRLDYMWPVSDRREAEKGAHEILEAHYKRKNEWFACGPEQARILIEGTLEDFDNDNI